MAAQHPQHSKKPFLSRGFSRTDRLRELLKAEVTRAMRSLKDARMGGLLTITDVEVSADLKRATIYYSVLGSEFDRRGTAQALERSAAYLQRELRHRLSMKFIPRLSFAYDETPERASRIEKLFNKISKENPQP